MSKDVQTVGEEGLRFFGKMAASVSHEIKNTLSIMNESAGLLDDLTVLAEKGMPIDPARLKNHAGKIMKQIQRADGIVKLMNRFAHSVDDAVKIVDLYDSAELMTALSARFASMRGVDLATARPEKPITVRVNPFFLNHALWVCLDFAMDNAGKGQTVALGLEEKNKRATVRFAGLRGFGNVADTPFPGALQQVLIEALGADITVDKVKGEVVLSLPSGPPGL